MIKHRSAVAVVVLLLTTGCSFIEFTPGTGTSKPKIDLRVVEECKVRVRVSRQELKCKWRI